MKNIKKMLFDAYGGFADKRIKNLEKGKLFIIDDRGPGDIGADKNLFSYFCLMFAEVIDDSTVKVDMWGNVPLGTNVKEWAKKHGAILEGGDHPSLKFDVTPGNTAILSELANAIMAIVSPGAPRYSVRSYKYVCPRTAQSLKRLQSVLEECWSA